MSNASRNPDNRPLPSGWIEQYDPRNNAWFYVNMNVNPPETTWVHPVPSEGAFSPPPGPPPPAPYGGPNAYPQGPQYPQQYGEQYEGERGLGSSHRGRGRGRGRGGHSGGGPSYGPGYGGGYQEQPHNYAPQQEPQHSGMSGGAKMALGAGVGLVGGFLLGEEFEHIKHKSYEEGLHQGEQIGHDEGLRQGDQVAVDQGVNNSVN